MSIRIFQASSLSSQQLISLDEKASHHLARVLRVRVGDEVILFNGAGGEYTSVITRIDKKSVTVEVGVYSSQDRESALNIELAQGIARGEKMDMIIQKAVELGVKKITPLISERSQVKLAEERQEKRLQHWRSIVISACEQCGRNRLPEINAPMSLTTWLAQVQADKAFVLSPHLTEKLASAALSPAARIVVLIGPEGGLSESEVQQALAREFIPLNLGPRVLRTETATVSALSVLQYSYGDMG